MDPEEQKLVTLARSAVPRSRGAREGAAVCDDIGRTYAAAAVSAGPLRLTALEVAVAMAMSSGVTRLDRAVLVAPDDARPTEAEREVLLELGDPGLTVIIDELPA